MQEPDWTKNKDQRASTQDDERHAHLRHARRLQHQPGLKGAWGQRSAAVYRREEGDKSLTTQDAFILGYNAAVENDKVHSMAKADYARIRHTRSPEVDSSATGVQQLYRPNRHRCTRNF